MQLHIDLEDKLWVEINKIEEEGKVPYISSVERIGYQRGLDKGKDEGKTEGRVEYIGLGLRCVLSDLASAPTRRDRYDQAIRVFFVGTHPGPHLLWVPGQRFRKTVSVDNINAEER